MEGGELRWDGAVIGEELERDGAVMESDGLGKRQTWLRSKRGSDNG